MGWIEGDEAAILAGQPNQPAWRIVDAAEQAAGWLVEPAMVAGRVELLTASLQLSQAADLLVDREHPERPRVPLPSADASIDVLCRELLDLLAMGRARLARECGDADAGSSEEFAARGHAALLVDQAYHTIAETLQ